MWSLMPTELKTNVTCIRDTCLETVENYYKEPVYSEPVTEGEQT